MPPALGTHFSGYPTAVTDLNNYLISVVSGGLLYQDHHTVIHLDLAKGNSTAAQAPASLDKKWWESNFFYL